MSRSRNTERIENKANDSFSIDDIKLVRRKPFVADIHPLEKNDIKSILRSIPIKYLYKLKTIELRPRKNEPGNPWGQYLRSESKIILYSHPLIIEDGSEYALNMAFASNKSFSVLADIKNENGKDYSVWSKAMLQYFYIEILFHEIGHHYYTVTKFNKKPIYGKFHELVADLYKDKLFSQIEKLSALNSDSSERDRFKEAINNFINSIVIEDNMADDKISTLPEQINKAKKEC